MDKEIRVAINRLGKTDFLKLPLLSVSSNGKGYCHRNSVILSMSPKFDGWKMVQGLMRDHTCTYHAHSFLVNPKGDTIVDAVFYPTIGKGPIDSYLSYGFLRCNRSFTREKVLYWTKKMARFGPWDKFVDEVDNEYFRDSKSTKYNYLDDEECNPIT